MLDYNIILINPTYRDIFEQPNRIPLGLAYIAGVLEKKVKKIKVIDLAVEKLSDNDLKTYIKEFKPHIIGFTATTPVINSVYRLSDIIKKIDKNIIIIAGGAHPSALPDESLGRNIDLVVRGEGEETIIELLENINKPDNIKGVSFKKNKKIIHNKERQYIKNLDKLPFPAIHLFPPLHLYKGQPILGNKTPFGSIITSRGCPFQCNFCYKGIFGHKYRIRSVDSIFKEWKLLVEEYKVKEMSIVDDNFTQFPDRVTEFCDRIISEKLDLPWNCCNGIRVNTATYKLLKKMKDGGCYRVAVGVESGSQAILDRMKKKITLEQVIEVFSNARQIGIQTMAFVMFGNIGENKETMKSTIEFAKKIKPDYVQFLIATPFPGTPLRKDISTLGKITNNDWDTYGPYENMEYFEMPGIKKGLLLKMQKEAYRKFYFRFSYIIKKIFDINTYIGCIRILKGFIKLLFNR